MPTLWQPHANAGPHHALGRDSLLIDLFPLPHQPAQNRISGITVRNGAAWSTLPPGRIPCRLFSISQCKTINFKSRNFA